LGELLRCGKRKPSQIKIYEIVERDIKSICDIFYNFCNNYLLNGFTHENDYINFAIHNMDDEIHLKGCYIRYCTFDNQQELESQFESVLTINNIDDLDKYYDTLNLMKPVVIFLKLKN